MAVQRKLGKKGKRQRKHKFTDPLNRARINIQKEMKKAEDKIKKLLKLRNQGKKRSNSVQVIRDEDGKVKQEKTITRYQGMKKDSKQHKRLLGHISRLKTRFGEIKGEYTKDPGGKSWQPQ